MVITLGQQYNVGEKPTVILYTYFTLIAMQGHQQKGRQTNTSSNNKDKSNTIIETSTAEDHVVVVVCFSHIALYPYTVTTCFQDWSASTFGGDRDQETAQMTSNGWRAGITLDSFWGGGLEVVDRW